MSAPSVLEYARAYGLAIDYTAEDLFEHLSQLSRTFDEEDSNLPDLDFSQFSATLSEPKLELSYQAGSLLAESIRPPDAVVKWDQFLPERHRVQKLKIEEPLLNGDHETDVRRFKRRPLRHRKSDELLESCLHFPSSPSAGVFEDEWRHIESGGALKEIEQELQDEKFHATKSSLMHLSSILEIKLADEERTDTLRCFLPCLKRSRTKSLTPELTPGDISPSPDARSTPDTEFPIQFSDEVDFDSLLLMLGKHFEERDHITLDKVLEHAPTSDGGLLQEAGPTLDEKNCQVHRRESEPLLQTWPSATLDAMKPSLNSIPPQQQMDFAAEYGNSLAFDRLPMGGEIKGDELVDDLTEEFFKFSEAAADEVDCEFLPGSGSAPKDYFKHPVSPIPMPVIAPLWEQPQDQFLADNLAQMPLTASQTETITKDTHISWKGIPSHLLKLQVHDRIEDDGSLPKWIELPQKVNQSSQMVYKRPGLRILDLEDESDDELEEDTELLREMSKSPKPTVPSKRLDDGLDSTFNIPAKKARMGSSDSTRGKLYAQSSSTTSLNDFSTSSALQTFLDLRGSRFRSIAAPPPPTEMELMDDLIQLTQSESDIGNGGLSASPSRTSHARNESAAYTIQVPSRQNEISNPKIESNVRQEGALKWTRTAVVDIKILQSHRSLVIFLEKTCLNKLNVVYRDFAKIGRDDHVRASPDMILNPKAALIFTSLQALNQKSLPGQSSSVLSMVYHRIVQLADDYDRLFILITGPSSSSNMPLTYVDTMNAFAGFCANISTSTGSRLAPVCVLSVADPRETDEKLNHMVWKLICQYAFPEADPATSAKPEIDRAALMNEETAWEQFLRRIGLNPMAAQLVLAGLKCTYDAAKDQVNQSWGLRRFIQMHPRERREMFSSIIGERMVDRVNDVLEQSWG